MSIKSIFAAAVIVLTAVAVSGCGNTIRGVGKDTANAVDATKAAGRSVAHAASH
jgi:entericidin B